jgi:hypothetical protein
MKDGKDTFNVLASVEKHIQALKPLLPKQAIVCIGEYPIKILLKGPAITQDSQSLPIFIEKSTEEVEKWTPKGFNAHYVLGFEDQKIESHFWYNALPFIVNDESVVKSLKKKSLERLHGAIVLASVWDGIGSASLPALIAKFKSLNQDSLGMAILPSKIQPTDAQFNTYASLLMCQNIEGATVLLIDRDHLENYEGVNRQGEPIEGNTVANYLVNLFLSKETLVDEVSELSRTFGTKLFTPLLVTGASWKIYGSVENMLNTTLLKPFLTFDLATSTVLYVLLRMPLSLKDKLPRSKIELSIANWFENKANLESIYITEPIYTQDMNDRIDVVMFVGGFNTDQMFGNLEKKVTILKKHAVEKGFMTEDGQITFKIDVKPAAPEEPANAAEQLQKTEEPAKETQITQSNAADTKPNVIIETETAQAPSIVPDETVAKEETKLEQSPAAQPAEKAPETKEEEKPKSKAEKPNRTRTRKKAAAK